MKAKDQRPRFDVGSVRELAGEKTFARGEAYFHDGQVQIIAIEGSRVLAQVSGSEDYRVELTRHGKDIEGKCSCPAFTDWGFCKHMVATALAANAAGDGPAAEGVGVLSRIRAHLKAKSVDELVAMVMELAERDPTLLNRLDMSAASVSADDKTLETRLSKAIDRATRISGYIDYRAAAGWAGEVETALDAVADLVAKGRAALGIRLAERAMERIEDAFESIDDSDGHLGALFSRAGEIHLAAVCATRPDPVSLARDLFRRELHCNFDFFASAAETYAEALGGEGCAEYRRLAEKEWEKIQPALRGARKRSERPESYYQVRSILDFFATCDGDVDARIALHASDLSSPWDYLQLAELCLSHDREAEALRRAEEGLWMFEDERTDERLLFFAVDLLCKNGRRADAEAHLWRVFEKRPSLELYKWLRKLGGKTARDRAVKLLEERMTGEKPSQWHSPADLLISILMKEGAIDAAWRAVRAYGASMNAKQELAKASEAKCPSEALEIYAERVEQLAAVGGSGYGEAAKLVARMAGLRDKAEQSAYVAALKERHGRKRNFMKLLG